MYFILVIGQSFYHCTCHIFHTFHRSLLITTRIRYGLSNLLVFFCMSALPSLTQKFFSSSKSSQPRSRTLQFNVISRSIFINMINLWSTVCTEDTLIGSELCFLETPHICTSVILWGFYCILLYPSLNAIGEILFEILC